MSTYQRWLEKFNAGGHETFEEFICNELDSIVDFDPDAEQLTRDDMQNDPSVQSPTEAGSDRDQGLFGYEPPGDIRVGSTDDDVPPTDPNAGSPPDA